MLLGFQDPEAGQGLSASKVVSTPIGAVVVNPPGRPSAAGRRPRILRAGTSVSDLLGAPRWLVVFCLGSSAFLLAAVSLWVLVLVLAQIYTVTVAVVVAVLLAALTHPLVRLLERLHLGSAVGALIALLGTIAALAAVVWFFVERVRAESEDLGAAVDRAWAQLRELALKSPLPVTSADLDRVPDAALDALGHMVPGPASGAAMAIQFFTGLFLLLFLWFFLLKDGSAMWRWFVSNVSGHRQDTLDRIGHCTWTVLTAYVRGTTIIAVADAAGIGVALLALGVPLTASLTLIVFFGAYIPIVGSTISGSLAVAVTLVTVGAWQSLVLLGAVLLVQQLEGNLLQPLIMGRALRLHPVTIVVAVTVGSLTAGVLGAVVAVPLVAIAYRVSQDLRERTACTPASPAGDGDG